MHEKMLDWPNVATGQCV